MYLYCILATHLSNATHNNGPSEPSTSQSQSSSVPQTSKNSRIAISYITNHGALENGLDYRQSAPTTSSSNARLENNHMDFQYELNNHFIVS